MQLAKKVVRRSYHGSRAATKLRRGHGSLLFIKGNHDKKDNIQLFKRYGTYLGEQTKIKIQYGPILTDIVLNHFAMRVWDKSHHGAFHFYGHSHDGLEKEPWGKSMDVGIMTSNRILGAYIPFCFEELYDILSKRETKIIDHHGLKARGYEEKIQKG